ncbi:MAG: hypothetical protein H0U44_08960 [Flavisolibacter sp.]|jgi:hypothetical protein|nr:hypothetical protein [Flavisolibacter sp.]
MAIVEQEEGIINYAKKKIRQLLEWVKPVPEDPVIIKILKLIYKSIAVLLLIAFSPVILVVLIFVFLAAI